MALSKEIATLSSENRELRSKIETMVKRVPSLDFMIESNTELKIEYTRPATIIRRSYTKEEAFEYLAYENKMADNRFEFISELGLWGTNSDGSKAVEIDINDEEYKNEFLGKIEKYNKDLPTQEEYDEYNSSIRRFTNMTENNIEANLSVSNNGNSMANNVTISLQFPPELLVFEKYDIENAQKPKKLKLPLDPFVEYTHQTRLDRLVSNAITPYLDALDVSYPLHSVDLSLSKLNYTIWDERQLCYTQDSLLHTLTAESDNFYIVATKRGSFDIEAELICAEFEEPIKKTFTVVVE
jgi:hypothetical protein